MPSACLEANARPASDIVLVVNLGESVRNVKTYLMCLLGRYRVFVEDLGVFDV